MITSGSPWSWCLLSFLLCIAELFLSLHISSNFGLCPGHSEYYETLGPVNNTPAACLVAQSCPTLLLSPVQLFLDCSLPGSSAHGIAQARILKYVAISFSRGYSRSRDQTLISCVSCMSRRILYHWATWQALKNTLKSTDFCLLV